MTDEEKVARLERALQEPEGKYTHDQIRGRLQALRGAGGGRPMDLGPGSKDPDAPSTSVAESDVPRPAVPMRVDTPGSHHIPGTDPMEVDPVAQGIAAGAIGMAAGAPVGGAVGAVAPSLAPVVAGAAGNAAAAASQGADLRQSGRAAVIGALMGLPAGMGRLIRRAPAATDARLQAAIDPTRGASARRVAGALPMAREAIEETPGLKKTLITSSDPAEKAAAVAARNDELTALTDADWDKVGQFYGGSLPLRTPQASLADLAERARSSGNLPLMRAAHRMAEDLPSLVDQKGGLAVQTLRGLRNRTAEHVAALNPAGNDATLSAINRRNAGELQGALNDSVARMAHQVPGLDVDGMMRRSGQVGSLIPVQQSLDARAVAAGLGQEEGLSGLPHTWYQFFKRGADKTVAQAAKADFALTSPAAQAVGGVLPQNAPAPVDPLTRALRARRKNQESQNAD